MRGIVRRNSGMRDLFWDGGCVMDFVALAAECAPMVAPQTLVAIIKTESGFNPLAIGVNGGARLARQPSTKEEAVVTANWLISKGYSIDVGLGQVNWENLAKMGLSVEDAFNPCKNLKATASILQSNYRSASRHAESEQAALHAALSAYNTGSFSKGIANGYVQRVINNSSSAAVMPVPLARGPGSRHENNQPTRLTLEWEAAAKSDEGNVLVGEGDGESIPSIMVYR